MYSTAANCPPIEMSSTIINQGGQNLSSGISLTTIGDYPSEQSTQLLNYDANYQPNYWSAQLSGYQPNQAANYRQNQFYSPQTDYVNYNSGHFSGSFESPNVKFSSNCDTATSVQPEFHQESDKGEE